MHTESFIEDCRKVIEEEMGVYDNFTKNITEYNPFSHSKEAKGSQNQNDIISNVLTIAY